jgi:hypothetical protein
MNRSKRREGEERHEDVNGMKGKEQLLCESKNEKQT